MPAPARYEPLAGPQHQQQQLQRQRHQQQQQQLRRQRQQLRLQQGHRRRRSDDGDDYGQRYYDNDDDDDTENDGKDENGRSMANGANFHHHHNSAHHQQQQQQQRRCARALRFAASLPLIMLYFALSIGLTFYQRWLLKGIHFPLSIVSYHLIVKFALAALVRGALWLKNGAQRVQLPFFVVLHHVAPTGLASGIDVGCSNWALELVNISLYTMTKSTTIVFILFFAILLGLEKKSLSLVMIVVTISTGLTMFTYKATQFNTMGFVLLIIASLASGLRWTFAQVLMQKSKLGLNHPLDLVYYVQPWMLMSVVPFAIYYEGVQLIDKMRFLTNDIMVPYFFKISFGAVLAFVMELSEFLVVTYTSSLTLSIAGIFKEIILLVLAVTLTGDVLSRVNVLGLCVCLVGIVGHVAHKFWSAGRHSATAAAATVIDHTPRFLDDSTATSPGRDAKSPAEHSVPLLGGGGDEARPSATNSDDDDGDRTLFDVLQRRGDVVR